MGLINGSTFISPICVFTQIRISKIFLTFNKEVILSQKYSGSKIKNALWIFAVSIKRGNP